MSDPKPKAPRPSLHDALADDGEQSSARSTKDRQRSTEADELRDVLAQHRSAEAWSDLGRPGAGSRRRRLRRLARWIRRGATRS